ncbi:DNA mismatch repair protein MutS [Gemmatimonadota bacterium]
MARSKTPLMQQYLKIKDEHPDEILLFRLGDFYETFFDDAKAAARALDIVLTSRNAGDGKDAIPLAGFPAHAAENYISRLLRAGHRVAVCEQVEDPKQAKGLVKREVVEVLSTGTALAEGYLEGERNNYLMSIAFPVDGGEVGIAVADVSTGDLQVMEVPPRTVADEVQRYLPAELVIPDTADSHELAALPGADARTLTTLEAWHFSTDIATRTLQEHLGVETLKGYGLDGLAAGTGALGALISYLGDNRLASLAHLRQIRIRGSGEGMLLDAATQRNLELVANIRDGGKTGTLLDVLDHTRSAMGARTLRNTLLSPLTSGSEIERRLDAVEALSEEPDLREDLFAVLDGMGDLERIAVRIETRKASPRDLKGLTIVQAAIPGLIDLLHSFDSDLLGELADRLDPLVDLTGQLLEAIVDEPPIALTDGGIIREGHSAELDRLRTLLGSGKQWISDLQQAERERTGIPSLKIGYNKVFGYYLEVTKIHADKVPGEYIRKQTLVSAERYVTPDLKEKEEEVLGAEEKASALEYELFDELRSACAERLEPLQRNAATLAMVDMLSAFCEAAVENGYTRPRLSDDGSLQIEEGRHPVVEELLPGGTFIPNDVQLDRNRQIALVTGPNMAGKSTYLRQTGLICLMAQTGSFVPAAAACLPVLDRIFTRVGAMDNLAGGESTFLVEMHETANILHNATADSLVLLDEVGRGTSTYDGLSIAWAVGEYLHEEVGARTIFATHYHELTILAERLPRVFNLNVAVKEWGERVIFLHKIVSGGCDHSYGIHVAELAGVPEPVLGRAREILRNLEEDRPLPEQVGGEERPSQPQVELFTSRPDALVEALKGTDPDHITPVEALKILVRLKDLL